MSITPDDPRQIGGRYQPPPEPIAGPILESRMHVNGGCSIGTPRRELPVTLQSTARTWSQVQAFRRLYAQTRQEQPARLLGTEEGVGATEHRTAA